MQIILCKTNQKLIFVWKALFLLNLPRKRIELNVFYFYYCRGIRLFQIHTTNKKWKLLE